MTFDSFSYLALLLVVVVLVRSLPGRFRIPVILAGCFVFYVWWRPEYVLLILVSVCVDYAVALRIQASEKRRRRRFFLALSVVSNLGLLFFFKYYSFAADSLRVALGLAGVDAGIPALDLLLPIGISFYTFQTLSYTIEVYLGRATAERRFPLFCLYVMFFPQLVAGPIERPQHLLPQLERPEPIDGMAASEGFRRILWGLLKKMVIADRLASVVDPVYAAPGEHSGLTLLAATYAFAFQIYCDFSGYSDIAIGSARLLGVRLVENFRTPYFARSVGEFWKRWHISLSSWFRDYVYIPLGGSRTTKTRWLAAILITFVASGIWHGANWTFLLWGAYHGCLLLLSVGLSSIGSGMLPRLKVGAWLQGVITFHLICAGWILFRAESVSDALVVASGIAAGVGGGLEVKGVEAVEWWIAGAAVVMLLAIDAFQHRGPIEKRLGRLKPVYRWAAYVVFWLLIFNVGVEREIPFIYFQF